MTSSSLSRPPALIFPRAASLGESANAATTLPKGMDSLSPVVAAVVVWAGLATVFLFAYWPQLHTNLVSPDDAMRLVEVRAFLHGGSWFDLTEPRLGFAPGYITHWSRLLDAPIAGLILFFSAIGGSAFGEDAGRAAWPLLLLLPLFLSLTALAGDIGGRSAALRAPLLGLLCLGGLFLFRPGAIHHHNAQLTLSVVFVALSFRAPRSRGAAISTGVLGALAIAVGLESLAILGVAAAGYALRFMLDPKEGRNFGAFGLSMAIAGGILFLATVPAHLWAVTQCDAYAVNMFALLGVGGLGASLTARFAADRSRAARLFGLVATGALAVAAYGFADPACLKGPFGHIDPEIWALWLSHVSEMRSVPDLFTDQPWHALLAFIAMALAGLVALPFLWKRNRGPEALILGALLLVAAIIGALHIRGVLYANWFAVPILAGASTALRLDAPRQDARQGSFGLRPRTFVLAGLLILASATTFFTRWRGEGAAGKGEEQAVTCLQLGDYAGLASLPPGLVLPDIDLGGFVLATTKHRVLLAPYHRLQKELIFARRLGAGDPAAAAEPLRRLGIDYLVDCRGTSDPVQDIPSSLRTAMMSGHAPAFLEPILADPPSRLMVWRVVK